MAFTTLLLPAPDRRRWVKMDPDHTGLYFPDEVQALIKIGWIKVEES